MPLGVETEECKKIRAVCWETVKRDFQYWTWGQEGWKRADVLLENRADWARILEADKLAASREESLDGLSQTGWEQDGM